MAKNPPLLMWQNPIVSLEGFFKGGTSPSQLQGMSLEEELGLRMLGAHLVQRGGRLLRMPQAVMMTGQIILQQFYCQQPLHSFAVLDVAMACTLIAGKVEECYRRVRDVVNIYYYLWQYLRSPHKGSPPPQPMEYTCETYYEWRERVTRTEMQILRELGFHVQPRHPVGMLANYLNALELSEHPHVGQLACNYLNDSLRSIAYVCFQPAVLACAAIELAARDASVPLPRQPAWHRVFDVERVELERCMETISNVYRISLDTTLPLDSDELEEYNRQDSHGMRSKRLRSEGEEKEQDK